MKEKILALLKEIELLKNNISADNKLPADTYYLNDENILCMGENNANIRYPYEMDGMNLWAYSNGHIDACESKFVIFRTAYFNSSALLGFWGGVKKGENEWFPLSVTGANKQLFEPDDIKRYTVFTKRAAYYILDSNELVFAVRANVTFQKQINFTVCAINKTSEVKEAYLSALMDFCMRYTELELHWFAMKKYAKLHDNGNYTIRAKSDIDYYAVINKKINSENKPIVESTTSKIVFSGGTGRNMVNAKALKTGCFDKKVCATNTSDEPVVSDIVKFKLNPGEMAELSYLITIVNDEEKAKELVNKAIDTKALTEDIKAQEIAEKEKFSRMSISFNDMKISSINKNVFNNFLKNVQKQVDLCAHGKNYAGDLIGIRDVFQQLDTSVMWNPAESRKKIIVALNYIFSNGRSPRQFSIPAKEGLIPDLNTCEFIDQGIWIIETLYNYLAVTGDYIILDEKCSYYDIIDIATKKWVKGETTTVLEHLLRIMKYLISNVDENTNCLRILRGDWNDAITGLGVTKDKDKEFGSGVSVMASLQFYRNLLEMTEILSHVGGYEEECKTYMDLRQKIHDALIKLAVVDCDEGKHIIHGWGDKKAYSVCTPNDPDGKKRHSSTVNSFWCISEMINDTPEIKKDILRAYEALDSKYGIRTCYPHFERDTFYFIGNVANLTPGTYENGCAYVHSTMFAAMALFILGESKKAWEQIEKAIPITHSYITKTPFVMPNSYCYNEEYNMDGESMGDWYTGSGCVLMRNIIKHVFGIQPDLDGVKIKAATYMPTDSASIKIKIKNCEIEISYKNENAGERKYFVNGIKAETFTDKVSDTKQIYLENDKLKDKILIEIKD
ncbi:MAG: hypothetical protein IKW59_08845 [Clostridia bacterium]|nr:hypothetical protein [Clostridia bacterium]